MSTLSADYDTTAASGDAAPPAGRHPWSERLRNNWPVVPMRIFLGAVFLFGGYAKFSYPGFFSSDSPSGLRNTMIYAKNGSPIRSALTPIINNASLFGHIVAGAEFAIGAGLVVGALTRIAALGGIVLTTLIALSVNWGTIRVYTAQSGWFTSVDIAIAVALTVFVIGGAGPLSVDRLVKYLRDRQEAREAAEPGFAEPDPEASRRRLQATDPADYPTAYVPPGYAAPAYAPPVNVPPAYAPPAYAATPGAYPSSSGPYSSSGAYQAPAPTYPPADPVYPPANSATQQIPVVPPSTPPSNSATQQIPVVPPPAPAPVPDPSTTNAATTDPPTTNPPQTDAPTTGYPPITADLEHDEAAEVEPSPRGHVEDKPPA